MLKNKIKKKNKKKEENANKKRVTSHYAEGGALQPKFSSIEY
jgi:hypothetical protein